MKTVPPEVLIYHTRGLEAYFPGLTETKLVRGILRELSGQADAPVPAAGELLTIREVCTRAKISRTLCWRLVKHGRLQTIHLGRSVRIPESELVRLAQGGRP